MNLKRILYGSAVAGVLLTAQSCEKVENFGDINTNPGQTTQPVPAALLTNTLANIGNNLVWDQGGLNTLAGLYAQYFSETQYTDASRYSKPNVNWDGYYSGPLYDLQNIINYNTDPNTASQAALYGDNDNQIAIARILRAQYYKFLSDAYGDVPYAGALQGSGIVAYDRQEQIYPALLNEVKEAVDQLDASAAIAIRGDILYNGNINAWKRYGNSLRAIMALQLSKANATLGSTEFNAAISHPAGVIETNAQSAVINYPGSNYRNPFYNYYNVTRRFDYAISAPLVSRLASTGDDRIEAFAEPSAKGFPYGYTREDAVEWTNANSDYSLILNGNFRNENSPMTLIGAANVWLARAEAALRGWTTENATTAFQTGIQRDWEEWGVYDATQFASYIAGIGAPDLTKVATEEWVAWFPNGMEGWNVYRRTGVPALTPAPGTTAIPRRIPYGPNEYNLNPTNVADAASRYNNDSQFSNVWWAQ